MPETTSPGVMLAPTFDIVNLKSKSTEIANRHAKMVDFTTWKYISRDRSVFGALFAKRPVVAFGRPADGVMQIKSARFQQAIYGLEISWMICNADLFKHADRGDFVKTAVDLSIIAQLECNAILQTKLRDFILGIIELFLCECHAMSANAVMLSGMADECSPPATDIQQRLASF